jgi:hypothetical protein
MTANMNTSVSRRASDPCAAGRAVRTLLLPALGAVVLLAPRAAPAASIDTGLTLQVVAVDPALTELVAGDRFTLAFTIDDQDLDTNPSVGAGTFPGLVTAFSATPDPGNTATWDPSVGSFDPGASNFVTNAFGDNFTLQVHGSGFPTAGGFPFWDFSLGFGWPAGVSDSGTGDTFAEQLGLAEGAFDLAAAQPRLAEIRFLDGMDLVVATATVVPEPGAGLGATAALASLVGLGCARRRRPVAVGPAWPRRLTRLPGISRDARRAGHASPARHRGTHARSWPPSHGASSQPSAARKRRSPGSSAESGGSQGPRRSRVHQRPCGSPGGAKR